MPSQILQIAAAGFSLEAGAADLGDGVWTFTGSGTIAATIPIPFGARLMGFTLGFDRGGTGTISVNIFKKSGSTKTTLNSTSIASGTGWTTTSVALGTTYVVEATHQLYVQIQCSAAANLVGSIFIDFETAGYVDVKTYGAMGDGATDDRAAIMAAISAAASMQERLYFPAGTYMISQDGSNAWCIDFPVSDIELFGVCGLSVIKAFDGMPGGAVALIRINAKRNVTFRDLVLDGNWGNRVTSISYGSNLDSLPQSTLDVRDTSGFPASGTFKVFLTSGTQTITYGAKTATSFTSCSGGTGVLVRNAPVGYVDSQTGINHTTQTDPQNHGLFIRGSSNVTIDRCTLRQIYGDAIWLGTSADDDLWNWARDIRISDCIFDICARNGITFGSGVERIYIERNILTNIFTAAIDSEPQEYFTAPRDVLIRSNHITGWFNPEANSQLILSCVGSINLGNNQTSVARNWRIEDNFIGGSVHINTAVDIVFSRNRVVLDRNASASLAWPPLFIDHTADDITVDDNYIYDNLTKSSSSGGPHNGSINVVVYSNGAVDLQPAGVRITRNRIHSRKGVNGIWVNGVGGFAINSLQPVTAPVSGTSTATSATTLEDTGKAWATNQWVGWSVISGGVVGLIVSNTATEVTIRSTTPVNPFNPTAQGWRTPVGTDADLPAPGIGYVMYAFTGRTTARRSETGSCDRVARREWRS